MAIMAIIKWAALAAVGAIAFPSVAFAGPLGDRLHHQDQRIYTGVETGSLTYGEYKRLERREDSIQAQRARDLRDGGGLTRYERFKLNQRLNQQSHRIYKQKHD
jgi:hypothetical protein